MEYPEMNAMVPNRDQTLLTDTIDHESGPDRPAGAPEMANSSPQGQAPFRYTYGSGARPLDGYTIKRAIGRGGFGEVYYATSDSGKEVALKLITRNVEVERRGVAQCMNLKCPNLLAIYDIRSNDAGEAFVVMEYVSGPSLAGVLEKHPNGMPGNELRAWLKGLVEGVDYLHDHGIVHRDLKPANLFMEDGVVKIGDYGLSKIISPQQGSEHSESIGTCHYMAPEISTGKYHKPIDIYAIGVILFEMLTGRVPFEGETVGEVLMKHLTTRPDLSRLAEPYKTLIGQALAKDPVNRPKRARDLLGPDESPQPRDVRFIGEGRTVPPTEPEPGWPRNLGWPWGRRPQARPVANGTPTPKPPEDDVLRIGEVDPVFYIGPETRPPHGVAPRRRPYVPPIRWVAPAPNPAAPRPAARPVAARQPRPAARPVPPPTPPPVEPPRPSFRVKVGELAGSLVSSALLIGALVVPAAALADVPQMKSPAAVAFLFGVTLLSTWGALIPSKLLEGSKADGSARRLLNLGVGSLVGLAAVSLAQWLHVGFVGAPPRWAATLVGFFGAAFLANGWWKVADRDRSSRVRVWPVALSGLIALALTPLWPHEQFWVQAVVPATAIVVQLVSPWSRPAAVYAAYKRKNPAVAA
jgi:eukaryotic-like serine/threonine-protein kinase